jgi:hypothetical protein
MTWAPRAASLLLALTSGLVACSGGGDQRTAGAPDSSAAAPADYKTVSAEGVSLAVPSSWVEQPTPGGVLDYGTAELSGGAPEQAVRVTLGKADFAELAGAAAVQAATTLTVVPGSKQIGRRGLDVPGAGPGLVTTMSFRTPGGGSGRLFDLVSITGDGRQLLVRVTTQSPSQDGQLADAVLRSVRLAG